MFARTTTVRGDPRAVDEGIAHVRDVTWPALQHMSGCVGLSMLADREAGRCIITTAWATDEAMRASAVTVQDIRREAAEVLRADTVEVAEWEIAVLHRAHAAGDAACARVLYADLPADATGSATTADSMDTADRMIDGFRMGMLPRMEELPGFCSVSLMVDRGMHRAVASVSYSDREAMARGEDQAMAMRSDFERGTGATITEVAAFDLVLAHLHVPEMA